MRLYFLRHGIAEDPQPGQTDRERRLTSEGIAEMQREAEALKRLALKPDLIVTSPYPRARETAEIVAKALDLEKRLHEEDRLAPGSRFGDLQHIVEAYPEAQRLLIVGHNPDLPLMAGQLIGSAQLDLKKGGLIRVDADRVEPGQGILQWLLTPSLLTALLADESPKRSGH